MAKMNIKKLAADHVEKGVFGLFVLIVLIALSGTKWSRYKGTPGEILKKVADGQRNLKANVWPEEEMQKYAVTKEAAPANIVDERLRREISPAVVEMSGRMIVDPFGGSRPVTEPVLKAPQDLIASSARVFINVIDESKLLPENNPEPLLANTPKTTVPGDDPNLPDELRKAANSALAGGMMGSEGEMRTYGSVLEYSPVGLESEGMGPGSGMNELKGEGYHFVSVRAVFPLREQISLYAEAINKPFHVAASSFDIIDFQLERKTAIPGDDPWAGPWEPVDMKMAEDILNKAADFDAEVVNPMITNAVITMPLPQRISGRWDRQATHPRIEKFTLSDEEIALEAEMQRKLLQEAVNQQKVMDSMVVRRRGFAQLTLDPNQLRQDVLGMNMYDMSEGGMGMGGGFSPAIGGGFQGGSGRTRGANAQQVDPMQKLIADMLKGSTNKAEEEARIKKWISSLVSAEGELLLFRYLDFAVEPGKTYQYRVRFELRNPNYGKRIAEAGGATEVVEGETRFTGWSNVTQPVTVEKDVKYFLAEVRPQAPRVLPTAFFDVFEWAQQYGTVVNALLDVRFGQQFRQTKETVVIDPAKGKNEKQNFEFKSTDYLVDVTDDVRVEESFHASADDGTSIKFPVGTRGRLPLAPKALVSNADLELTYLSPVLSYADHEQQKRYISIQADLYANLKAQENTESDAAMMELGLSGEEDGTSRRGSSSRNRRNELKLKRGLGRESSGS